MNSLIKFFEKIKSYSLTSTIEFSIKDDNWTEMITVTKGHNSYLFYFTKISNLFRSNLCNEIILITEDSADLKLELNNQLADYFTLKLENKAVDQMTNSHYIIQPERFVSQFENELINYQQLNYLYLTLKIPDKDFTQNKIIKKI